MRQVRELMRLNGETGRGLRETARRAGIAESTMREMVKRFDRSGLEWPLAADLDTAQLEAKLYGAAGVKPGRRRLPAPAWAAVHRELTRKHVTLQTLGEAYIDAHRAGRQEERREGKARGRRCRSRA